MPDKTSRAPAGYLHAQPLAASPLLWALTATLLITALVLGGGTRPSLWSDAAIQVLTVIVLATLALQSISSRHWPTERGPAAIVAAMLMLPLMQLLPLPPAVWTLLPGRAMVALPFTEAGIALPWLPISLDPDATWRALLSLLPGLAMFIAAAKLDTAARRSLGLIIIGLAVASMLLGLAQLMQGPASPLRLHPTTNLEESVGFFANRNHYAALLYATIPIVAVLLGLFTPRPGARLPALVAGALVFTLLILGLGMARSRAGIGLAMLAILACPLLLRSSKHHRPRLTMAALVGAIILGLVLVLSFAGLRLIDRLDSDILGDLRLHLFATTATAAMAYLPPGSGFGTFEAIYRIFEPLAALQPRYVNHAHNDWLEVVLEGGLPAMAVLVAFLVWFARASLRAWRAPHADGDCNLARAATITIALLLLHSLVDYPLRTSAMMAVFGWSAALLTRPPRPRRQATQNGPQTAGALAHPPRRA